jgi:hypothetical protein
MIDYLKLEASLKKFFDYEAQKEHKKRVEKINKKGNIIFLGLSILLLCITIPFFKDKYEFFLCFFLLESLFAFVFFMIIDTMTETDKNFETDNYETEENLKKVSEFGIKNITNFKENISLLRRKTEYMFLDENFKETKTYSPQEIYINKILNMFYETDKTNLKKQDMELLELLKK